MGERHLSLVPEPAEVVICGETKSQGGAYEWTCTLEPHGPERAHVMEPFKVA